MRSSAGIYPVVDYGVVRYFNKKLASRCYILNFEFPSRTCFLRAPLTILTDLLAAPLDAGWEVVTKICLIMFGTVQQEIGGHCQGRVFPVIHDTQR